jgi:transcription initiation factor IIE alpha subunit
MRIDLHIGAQINCPSCGETLEISDVETTVVITLKEADKRTVGLERV